MQNAWDMDPTQFKNTLSGAVMYAAAVSNTILTLDVALLSLSIDVVDGSVC